jgi:hypothetical protein
MCFLEEVKDEGHFCEKQRHPFSTGCSRCWRSRISLYNQNARKQSLHILILHILKRSDYQNGRRQGARRIPAGTAKAATLKARTNQSGKQLPLQNYSPIFGTNLQPENCRACRIRAPMGAYCENGDCPDFRVNENGTVPFRQSAGGG